MNDILPFSSDKMHESCGVFAIYAPGEDVARLTYFGLYALQHRGQESAGIAVGSGRRLTCYKDMGLVTRVFSEKILSILTGDTAIGHVRYSTTGSSVEFNAQPIIFKDRREIALAHNGNLVNTSVFREELEAQSVKLLSTTDSEIMAAMIARQQTDTVEDAIANVMKQIRGAYSVAVLNEDRIFGFRDPYGIRPLCIGRINGGKYVIASETCALNIVGATYVRDVNPGELVSVDSMGLHSRQVLESARTATCVFEFIYFARPDSKILGQTLYTCRRNMGAQLAKESPVEADVVMAVPDSSTPAAIGYSHASGIQYDEGLIKNRYVGRTFIFPDQRIRNLGVKLKFNPLRESIAGKRVLLVDDSIVRGTTSSKIIAMLYDTGAKEVHVRVSSPPVKHPCFYGIDMAEAEELLASSRNVEDIRSFLGADSLSYLSHDGMIAACGMPAEHFCTACFTGQYPISIPHQLHLGKFAFESNAQEPVLKLGHR